MLNQIFTFLIKLCRQMKFIGRKSRQTIKIEIHSGWNMQTIQTTETHTHHNEWHQKKIIPINLSFVISFIAALSSCNCGRMWALSDSAEDCIYAIVLATTAKRPKKAIIFCWVLFKMKKCVCVFLSFRICVSLTHLCFWLFRNQQQPSEFTYAEANCKPKSTHKQ